MTDIIVPIARVVDVVTVNEQQVPFDMKGRVSGIAKGMRQAEDFAHAIGRDAKPSRPLMVYGPDNGIPIMVIGDGVTEAAEMQDLAMEAIGRQEEQVRKNGRGFNFDEARERAGMVRKEDFDAAFRDALARRIAFLKANSVTQGR